MQMLSDAGGDGADGRMSVYAVGQAIGDEGVVEGEIGRVAGNVSAAVQSCFRGGEDTEGVVES